MPVRGIQEGGGGGGARVHMRLMNVVTLCPTCASKRDSRGGGGGGGGARVHMRLMNVVTLCPTCASKRDSMTLSG